MIFRLLCLRGINLRRGSLTHLRNRVIQGLYLCVPVKQAWCVFDEVEESGWGYTNLKHNQDPTGPSFRYLEHI